MKGREEKEAGNEVGETEPTAKIYSLGRIDLFHHQDDAVGGKFFLLGGEGFTSNKGKMTEVEMAWECSIGRQNVYIHGVPNILGEFKSGRDGKDRVVIQEGGVYGRRCWRELYKGVIIKINISY